MISLLPVGKCPKDVLEYLRERLCVFNMPVHICTPIPVPKRSYDPSRDQYRARKFLGAARKCEGHRVLAITAEDLYVKDLNFVFGLAEKSGRCAVISLARLDFGSENDDNIFFSRSLKEAVHELGHTFGLDHCAASRCVMHFSNRLLDTDTKRSSFCDRCARKLGLLTTVVTGN